MPGLGFHKLICWGRARAKEPWHGGGTSRKLHQVHFDSHNLLICELCSGPLQPRFSLFLFVSRKYGRQATNFCASDANWLRRQRQTTQKYWLKSCRSPHINRIYTCDYNPICRDWKHSSGISRITSEIMSASCLCSAFCSAITVRTPKTNSWNTQTGYFGQLGGKILEKCICSLNSSV
jgi:hypothetical protein